METDSPPHESHTSSIDQTINVTTYNKTKQVYSNGNASLVSPQSSTGGTAYGKSKRNVIESIKGTTSPVSRSPVARFKLNPIKPEEEGEKTRNH